MNPIKLEKPNQPLAQFRYEAQLERRGLSEAGSDGSISAEDGLDGSVKSDLISAAGRSGAPAGLSPEELAGMPVRRSGIASGLAAINQAVGGDSTEQTANRRTLTARHALASLRVNAQHLMDMRAAGLDSETLNDNFVSSLVRAGEALQAAATHYGVGLASEDAARALAEEVAQLSELQAVFPVRHRQMSMYVARATAHAGYENLKEASKVFGVELPERSPYE